MDKPNKREARDFSKYDIIFDMDGPDSLSLESLIRYRRYGPLIRFRLLVRCSERWPKPITHASCSRTRRGKLVVACRWYEVVC